MTPDMWLALGILVVAIILFISERVRVDVVALGVVVALALSGLLTVQEAIAGFSNTAVITIAALFIVGGAVMHTGLARAMGNRILAVAGRSPARLTAVIMLAVAFMSFFMSDTGVVAVMLPAVVALAADARIRPSKLLIPLAYGSLLGGLSTLIGTPPNLIVSDVLRDYGYQPFGFFTYTPMGLLLIAAGVAYILIIGRRLLPDYAPEHEIQR
ncbi:MAG TPA: SLC13 family permease, partial [Aggregatilineales bacterium]|nr:SLC13 family permease [Aggregatilineales bacterium]